MQFFFLNIIGCFNLSKPDLQRKSIEYRASSVERRASSIEHNSGIEEITASTQLEHACMLADNDVHTTLTCTNGIQTSKRNKIRSEHYLLADAFVLYFMNDKIKVHSY